MTLALGFSPDLDVSAAIPVSGPIHSSQHYFLNFGQFSLCPLFMFSASMPSLGGGCGK